MEATYINAHGERLALRHARPFFLTRAEGLGRTRQTISTEELAAWMSAFSFELKIPIEGFELGYRQPSQIMTLDNIGDVACGCRIVFRALGAVRDPDITDMNTGHFLCINKTLDPGEEIHVHTHFAGKRVLSVDEQTETNAFSFLDTGSTFLQLAPGRNTLRYGAAENMDLLEVSVYYRPQYLGV